MKNVGNSSDGLVQGVPKISGHPCIGRMGALRGHLCDSTAFLFVNLTASPLRSAEFKRAVLPNNSPNRNPPKGPNPNSPNRNKVVTY